MAWKISTWTAILLVVALIHAYPTIETRQAGCSSPVQRRSWTALSDVDKLAWINAVKCLQKTPSGYGVRGAQNLWDEIQWVHVVNKNWIHGTAAFLPWHRYYIATFQRMMQEHCQYRGGIPYWNEAPDASNIAASPVWSPTTGLGGNGLGRQMCVQTGPFSNLTLRVQGDGTIGATYCLARQFSQEAFSGASQSNVDDCFAQKTWAGASSCYENLVHNAGHDGTGRVMADALLAPGDPVFFLHHANLDRLWWRWQQANLEVRLTQMGRPNTPSEEFNSQKGWGAPGREFTLYSGDGGTETTLDHVLWVGNLAPNVTIRDVMDLRGGTICTEYVD